MKKKRSERPAVEANTTRATRWTRSRAREQPDEEPTVSKTEPLRLLKDSPLGRSRHELYRNPDVHSREMDASLEETLLTFLDTHGVREVEDIEEDKLAFVDATYGRCCVQGDASVPTEKMFHAIYDNIQESQSVELTTASFELLKDLEKRHPRVAIRRELDETSGQTALRLDIDHRVWSPVRCTIDEAGSMDVVEDELNCSVQEQISWNLFTLLNTIAMNIPQEERHHTKSSQIVECNYNKGIKPVTVMGQFLMLQHLVNSIDNNLYCCLQVYEARMDASSLQQSYLFRLLCMLPEVRKTFLSNLIFLLDPGQQTHTDEDEEAPIGEEEAHQTSERAERSNKRGLLPATSDFSHLAYKLLLMIMEIDYITRTWDPANARSLRRCRFPDDLLNIFTNARSLGAYLEALDSPWTKMRFIVDFFVANAPQDIAVKGLKDRIDRDTMDKLLASFGEDKTNKFVHKFGEDVLPLVLAHAFQASLIIHVEAAGEDVENEQLYQAKLLNISHLVVNTLTDLQEFERQTKMIPVAEAAMQLAQSILLPSWQFKWGVCT